MSSEISELEDLEPCSTTGCFAYAIPGEKCAHCIREGER